MATDTLTRMSLDCSQLSDTDQPVYDWLCQHFGAPPQAFYRLLRWRLGWEALVKIEGESRWVVVRATRGDAFQPPIPLKLEARLHDVMEQHGVRVPHVYGMIDEPLAIVMEKLPGGINSELIADEDDRWKVRREYIEMIARLHEIPIEAFAEAGLALPGDRRHGSLEYYRRNIALVRDFMGGRPFPFLEFLDKWLVRHCPRGRDHLSLVTADSGQFMYHGNEFTGLIDFELAYIGDPAAEFAGMRVRDTTEPLGDIGQLRDYYETLTGDHIDRKLIAYHSAGFAGSAGLLTWPMAYECEPDVDYVAYLQFSIAMCRWGLQGLQEFMDLPSQPIDDPKPNSTLPFCGATKQQQALMTTWKTDDKALQYHFQGAADLAVYMDRCFVYGQDILAADLADIRAITGAEVTTRDQADRVLAEWIQNADAGQDEALIRFFDRWFQRQNFLLKGCGSQDYLTACTLQPIPRRDDDQ